MAAEKKGNVGAEQGLYLFIFLGGKWSNQLNQASTIINSQGFFYFLFFIFF